MLLEGSQHPCGVLLCDGVNAGKRFCQLALCLGTQSPDAVIDHFTRQSYLFYYKLENTARVLTAFQKHRVADGYFAGTTGYGYDDLGRDKLDDIYAELFGTEAALVRIQFVNGTHAIACALFGALKAGDVLLSAVGAPYDTLLGVVGADKVSSHVGGLQGLYKLSVTVIHQNGGVGIGSFNYTAYLSYLSRHRWRVRMHPGTEPSALSGPVSGPSHCGSGLKDRCFRG